MGSDRMVRKHILFFGRVQGVGFRFYSVQKASSLGLTGWVKNLSDGSVEMEVQGEERDIDELIRYLRNRRFVDITHMEAENIAPEDEREFREERTW